MNLKSYEAGALAYLQGKPIPEGGDLNGNTERHGWYEARRFIEGGRSGQRALVTERERLTALWLEHRADQFEATYYDLDSAGRSTEADKADADSKALRVAAAYIRRELLGETSDG